MMAPFNLKRWIDENRHLLKPPVGNKLAYNGGYMVMVVGGPNQRNDFHVNPTEELFYQVEGDIVLRVVEDGKPSDIPIREGELFVLPANVPHSPQRPADTVGLVIEAGSARILLLPDQSAARVGSEVVSLSGRVQRDRNTWQVPIDFLSQALGPGQPSARAAGVPRRPTAPSPDPSGKSPPPAAATRSRAADRNTGGRRLSRAHGSPPSGRSPLSHPRAPGSHARIGRGRTARGDRRPSARTRRASRRSSHRRRPACGAGPRHRSPRLKGFDRSSRPRAPCGEAGLRQPRPGTPWCRSSTHGPVADPGRAFQRRRDAVETPARGS